MTLFFVLCGGLTALLVFATWRLIRLSFREQNHLVKLILFISAGITLTVAGVCLSVLGTCGGLMRY